MYKYTFNLITRSVFCLEIASKFYDNNVDDDDIRFSYKDIFKFNRTK